MNNEQFFRQKVENCIKVLQDYLPPDGIEAGEALTRLLGLLDNEEIVDRLSVKTSGTVPGDKVIVGGIFPELERPLCIMDLETTGTKTDSDRIVEITILKINPDLTEDKRTTLVNPGIPIPEEATKVHGVTNEMVQGKPTFESIAKSMLEFISGCDIAGFNSTRFDVPFLNSMFNRVNLQWDWKGVNLIDVRNIFVRKEERNLTAGVKFYLGRDHADAHSSEGDVLATKEILIQQLARYEDLPRTFKELAAYSNFDREIVDLDGRFVKNEEGVIVFNFGKHVGIPVKDQKQYLTWMIDKGDFTQDTKAMARMFLKFQ